jgi:hypothetical protein
MIQTDSIYSVGHNKWKEDLTKDIRFGHPDDDADGVLIHRGFSWSPTTVEFTQANHDALQQAIDKCKSPPKYFMEIGVCRNGHHSSTHTILKNVPEGGIYLGVDIADKSFLNNESKGIHTIQTSSSNYDLVVDRLKSLGVDKLDFLFIDGWHSINQVLMDWEFSRIVSDGGVIAFHDTTSHPGPYYFINNLDRNKWEVFPNLCPSDHGFGYCFKKIDS